MKHIQVTTIVGLVALSLTTGNALASNWLSDAINTKRKELEQKKDELEQNGREKIGLNKGESTKGGKQHTSEKSLTASPPKSQKVTQVTTGKPMTIFNQKISPFPSSASCDGDSDVLSKALLRTTYDLRDASNRAYRGWGQSPSEANNEFKRYESTLAALHRHAKKLATCSWAKGKLIGNRVEELEELQSDLPKFKASMDGRNRDRFGRSFSQRMQSRAVELRGKKCKGSTPPQTLFFAHEQPIDQSTRFHFCDGWQVTKTKDGDYIALQAPLNSHPKWQSEMGHEVKKLEDARALARKHPDVSSRQRDLAAAEARVAKKTREFSKRHTRPRSFYEKAARSSSVKVVKM